MFQPIVGLEIHVELKTKTKMFCSCLNDSDERYPNVNVCPVCMSHPGTLPVINKEAVKKVIKTGLALHCQIPEFSKFDRKNYFYPDLPKGYQISQYDTPLCKGGFLNLGERKIRITRVHLEEDTGRLVHPEGTDYSLVDFNRAGIPLMELVTEPDLRSAEEVRKFAQEFQLILRYLDVSDADMEKGQMRVEVNISLQHKSQIPNTKSQTNPKSQIPKPKLGTKVEIKNLNSFRVVEKAIDYEIKRQSKLLEQGEKIIQETRGWNDIKQITVSQRKKEEANDYRYFPEPDLPPLEISKKYVQEIESEIPELPQLRRERFKKEYKLKEKEIEIFVQNKDIGEYFEKVMSELKNWVKPPHQDFGSGGKEAEIKLQIKEKEFDNLTKLATNYILTDLQALFKKGSVRGEDFLITPENFAEFISLIWKGEISSRVAKDILKEMFAKGGDPSQIIEERGLKQVSDESQLEEIVNKIIKSNPQPVKDYQEGKENILQFLIGQVMRETRGKANPKIIQQLLTKKLKS